jgi:tRNA (cytidine/uridine-2'-O-)-methyltransferase
MRLAIYEPDIPQNTGTILRLAGCLGVPPDLIGPAGFDMTDRKLKRAALDYLAHVEIERQCLLCRVPVGQSPARLAPPAAHEPWRHALCPLRLPARRHATARPRERRRPEAVRRVADARLRIPIRAGLRSLNVAVAGSMALGEALRQTGGLAGR